MSYTPTEWKAGDTVTSAKLNKLEQGVASSGSGVLMVHVNEETALDKTWKEINEAMQEKIVCISAPGLTGGTMYLFVSATEIEGSAYVIVAFVVAPNGSVNASMFTTDSEDGYPAYSSK